AQLDALLGEPRFESQIRRLPASIQQHLEEFFGGIYPDYLTLQDSGDQAVDGNGYIRRDLRIHLGSMGDPGQLRTLHFIFNRFHANSCYGADELIEEDVAGNMLIRSPYPNSNYIDRLDSDGMYQGAIYGDSFYGAFFFEAEPLAAHSYFEAVLEVTRSQGRAIVAPPASFRQRLTDTLGLPAQVFSVWQPELGLAFLSLAKAADFADSYDLKSFIEKLEVTLPFFQSHQDLVSKVYGLMPNDQNTTNPAYLQLVFQLTQRFGGRFEEFTALLTYAADRPQVTDRKVFLEELLRFHDDSQPIRAKIEKVYAIPAAQQTVQNQAYLEFLVNAYTEHGGSSQKLNDLLTKVIELDQKLGPPQIEAPGGWPALSQLPAEVYNEIISFYGAPLPNTVFQLYKPAPVDGVSTIRIHILFAPEAYPGPVMMHQLYFKRLDNAPYQLKYMYERDSQLNLIRHNLFSAGLIDRYDDQKKYLGQISLLAGSFLKEGRFLTAKNRAEALQEALGYEGVRTTVSKRNRFSAVFGIEAARQNFGAVEYRAKLLELAAAALSTDETLERMNRVFDMDQVLGRGDFADHRGEALNVLNGQPAEVKQAVLNFFGGTLPGGIKNISINNKPDEAGVPTIRVVVYFDPDTVPGPVQTLTLFFKKAPDAPFYGFRYFFENTLSGTLVRHGIIEKDRIRRKDGAGRDLEALTFSNGRYYLGTRLLTSQSYAAALNESLRLEGVQPVLSRRAAFKQISGIAVLDQRLSLAGYRMSLWQMASDPLAVASLLQLLRQTLLQP
nr:hypothetical protein [Candidatus Omnitrophota bacterium]